MAKPIVTWEILTSGFNNGGIWDLKTVDAGNDPALTQTEFYIWNNKAGGTDVSDMTDCRVSTKDTAGNMNIPLVKERWVQIFCNSKGETSANYLAIGAELDGTQTLQEKYKTIKASGAGVTDGVIKGIANDGLVQNSADNFSMVTMIMGIPTTATAGNVDFLTRVTYNHV